jgi:hypothetical protein
MPTTMWRHSAIVVGAVMAAASCGGCGRGPGAFRIRADNNDAFLPLGTVHFVERGRRGRGVFVMATEGFETAFRGSWNTMLVPTPPTAIGGPVWTGSAGGGRAAAIARLPAYRDARWVRSEGDYARRRFDQRVVWVLGTDPLILGLPAGEPRRAWPEYRRNDKAADGRPPLALVRYLVDEELDQPLARLVVYPTDYWRITDPLDRNKARVSLVSLPEPMSAGEVLESLAGGDPARLGAVETAPMRIAERQE